MIHQNTSIGAITLKVANFEKMVAFYRDVIGLQLLESSAGQRLGSHRKTATLGTPERPLIHLRHLTSGRRAQGQSGLFHLALRVPNRTALATWFRHYTTVNGPGWEGASDHGAAVAIYLNDPEGNGIEICYDLPREQWEYDENGTIKMVTKALDLHALLREANDNSSSLLDPATVMGHVHLSVSEIPSAKQFYVDLLGFDLQFEMPDSALFISAGNYHHHVGLNNWKSRGGPPNSAESLGLEQFEICFGSADSRQQAIERLTAHQIKVDTCNDITTVVDPFHNSVVLTIPD
ncbi:MAG: VOC family protein [Anaerolineae bacterium]